MQNLSWQPISIGPKTNHEALSTYIYITKYQDYAQRAPRSPSWDTFENQTQSTCLRLFAQHFNVLKEQRPSIGQACFLEAAIIRSFRVKAVDRFVAIGNVRTCDVNERATPAVRAAMDGSRDGLCIVGVVHRFLRMGTEVDD